MRSRIILIFLVIVGLFFLAGCKNWIPGKEMIRKNNCFFPAEVNVQKDTVLCIEEDKMACLICGMDRRLESLLREMDTVERRPEKERLKGIYSDYSWLNGVNVLDKSGQPVLRYPEQAVKELDYNFLSEVKWSWKEKKYNIFALDTPLGTELAIVKPMFNGKELKRLLLTHFDIRSLLNFSDDPGELLIFLPDKLLWSGEEIAESKSFLEFSWKNILEDRVNGKLERQGKRYYWMSRYVGKDPIIYMVRISN